MSDLISRQDALDAIKRRADRADSLSPFWEGLIIARDIVDNVPSAESAHKLDIDIAEHHRTFEQLSIEIARYQKAKAEMEEISADYVALKQWWTEQQVNPPLSWDELKAMTGKPVWVDGSAFAEGLWTIITGFGKVQDTEYVFLLGDQYWKEDMQDADNGFSWQAYRMERK